MTDNYKFDLFKTKPEKLTRWDADWYKSLTDDECIVCLSERQIYLIRMMLEPLLWSSSRWIGDKSELDFDLIKSELQFRLDEVMTCEQLTTILDTVNELQLAITNILNDINQDNIDPSFDVDTTTINDTYSPQELADFGVSTAACDTDGKNQIYAAIDKVVRFIAQNNTDFLEEIEQHVGNLAEVASTLLAAFPPTNFLAIDDLSDQVQFLIEELLEEYNATTDEALIQQTICDLFCIAVARDCALDFTDLLNYFANKLPNSPSAFFTSWSSLMQFAVIGTFSGDEYFYYMCFLQLFAALTGDGLYGSNPIEIYALQMRAGMNNPDNDWTILCVEECPTIVAWSHDIDLANAAYGMWSVSGGLQVAEGLRVVDVGGGVYNLGLKIVLPENNTLLAAEFTANNQASSSSFGLRTNLGTDGNFPFEDNRWSGALQAGVVQSPCKLDFSTLVVRQVLFFLQAGSPNLFLRRLKLQILNEIQNFTWEYVIECYD